MTDTTETQKSNTPGKKDRIWVLVLIAFGSLGLLVGSVSGLSSSELTIPLFGFLFSFVGGSLLSFFGKMSRTPIILSCIALASFSVAMLLALYVGLFIKVNEVMFLDSKIRSNTSKDSTMLKQQEAYRSILRNNKQELTLYLTSEIKRGNLSIQKACEWLETDEEQKKQTK
jgi:hypothetical protein